MYIYAALMMDGPSNQKCIHVCYLFFYSLSLSLFPNAFEKTPMGVYERIKIDDRRFLWKCSKDMTRLHLERLPTTDRSWSVSSSIWSHLPYYCSMCFEDQPYNNQSIKLPRYIVSAALLL